MSRFRFALPAARVLAASASLTLVFAAGVAAGFRLHPEVFTEAEPEDAHEHEDDHHEDDDPHVALTKQAFENLHLQVGHVQRGEYWKSLLVPAEVTEIPGRSSLSVAAPVTGVVKQVRVVPGQAILSEQPLFEIRLTDETLTATQAELLDNVVRQAVSQQEIDRLRPLTESGAVPETRKRELEYDLKQLLAKQRTLVQNLLSRGLPQSAVDTVLEQRKLATTLTVFAPKLDNGRVSGESSSTGYTIEQVHVHPGKAVVRGTDLCRLAYHSELYLCGTAFEHDLLILNNIAANNWTITVERHQSADGYREPITQPSLKLLRVDNHIDDITQTVRFYAALPNRVERVHRDDAGRRFEQWEFRPGQRLHLRLPVERWADQWVLPAEAVVVDGPDAFVFAEHHHDEHDHADEHDVFMELEPVPVRMLHRDDRSVVIADDGQITAESEIALNNVQKLYLAMKMQASGGGGHHHHHDH